MTGPWWTSDDPINPETEHAPQEAFFRAEFAGDGMARFRIAAQSFYQCWFNGHWLGYGPARAPHGRLTIDEWELPCDLAQEINTVSVQVFWEGIFVFDHVLGTPGLWLAVEREDRALPLELWIAGRTGRMTTHRSSLQRGWAEEIDSRQQASGWPCGKWNNSEWSRPVRRQSDPDVVLEPRDIAPYAIQMRRAQSVVFSGSCDLRQAKAHRDFYYENQPRYEDAPGSPSRQLQEEALVPSGAIDENLSALTASGSGSAVLGLDPEGKDRTAQLDFGQETAGLLELELEAPAGTVIDIGWSEGVWLESQMGCWAQSPHPDGAVLPREFCDGRQGLRYICSGNGRERFNSLFIAAFRHLRLAFRCPQGKAEPIKVHQLQVRTIGHPLKREGAFACADESLNRIYQAALATMENSISDVYMDCPGRERGAYLNDSYWTTIGFQAVSADVALERRFLQQFIETQTSTPHHGFIVGLYPSECIRWNDGKLRPWLGHALFWLIEVERYLRLYGEATLRAEWKPSIEKCLEAIGNFRGVEGLLERVPWDTYLDWSRIKVGTIQTGDNFLYALALSRLGRLYQDQIWVDLGHQTATAIENAAWSGTELYTDTVVRNELGKLCAGEGLSAVTNSVALWSKFVPQKRAERVWRQLRNHHPLTVDRPLFDYETDFVRSNAVGLVYRLEYQGRIADISGMVRDMKEAYLPMLDRGQSCLGEHLGYQGSLCHGYNGFVAYLLSRYVAGIELPDQPGGVIRIRPQPGQLPWCQARVPWMGAHVQVWWCKTSNGCRTMVSLPPGQAGEIVNPTTGETTAFTTSISVE